MNILLTARGFTVSQLLLYMSCLSLPTSAVNVLGVHPRADACVQENQDITVFDDGTTADGAAGIGVEFESPFFYFVNRDCNLSETNAARKQIVAGRTGTNFMLTADTGSDTGKLNAEYILDGKAIKVGTGQAEAAGQAVANDLIGWSPWSNRNTRSVDIANSTCNPWVIDGPPLSEDPANLLWQPQVTAPMPLGALYTLMKNHRLGMESAEYMSGPIILDGAVYVDSGESFVLVTKEYFQSASINIDSTTVTNDVLAFCSLVLSYAKAADKRQRADSSPKLNVYLMPRTDFTTIFKQVQSKLPGNLFTIFSYLACYQTEVQVVKDTTEFTVVIDTRYCSGTLSNPIRKKRFANLQFQNPATEPATNLSIKSWIQGIGALTPGPDLLTVFDRTIDGSIGGLGNKTENMYKSQISVPLFEFRGLEYIPTSNMQTFMANIDLTIQELHGAYTAAKRNVRRQASSAAICNFTVPVTTWQLMSSSKVPPAISTPAVTPTPVATPISATTSSSVVTSTLAVTTAATLSCYLQNEDPDSGINTQGCICGSTTLPLLTVTSATEASQSCYYTALPSTSVPNPISITTATYTSNCKACMQVGGVGGVATCTSVPSCTPTVPGYSTMTAHLDTSSVHVGVMNTATPATVAMTKIKSAVETLCPSIAADKSWGECNGGGAVFDSVETVVDQELMSGSLNFTIGGSNYTSNAFRELMLSLAVASFTKATLQNCQSVQYVSSTISDMLGDDFSSCPTPSSVTSPLDSRQVLTMDTTNCYSNVTVCNGPSTVFVQLEESDGSLANWLSLDAKFVLDKEPDWMKWVCELLDNVLMVVMDIVDPSLIAEDVFIGPELEAVCDCFNEDSNSNSGSQCPF